MNEEWEKAQKWELDWHDNCINSYYEEQKQLIYAEKMGLIRSPTPKTPYNFDLKGKSIIDIGSGPYSLLFKCQNIGEALAVDPLMDSFPGWVKEKYISHNIKPMTKPAEELNTDLLFDEAWIYNVLEHTYNPEKIVKNALAVSKVVRVFEWLDTPKSEGHPQTLREEDLNKWLGGEGKVETINRGGTKGKCYYGVFKGAHYE